MLQREVGGGKQFRGVQPPLCTAIAVFTIALYENSGNIYFTKWKMKKLQMATIFENIGRLWNISN